MVKEHAACHAVVTLANNVSESNEKGWDTYVALFTPDASQTLLHRCSLTSSTLQRLLVRFIANGS